MWNDFEKQIVSLKNWHKSYQCVLPKSTDALHAWMELKYKILEKKKNKKTFKIVEQDLINIIQ